MAPYFISLLIINLNIMNESDNLIVITEYDHCVACGKETEYLKDLDIGLRKGYVCGAGQLCAECFAEIYPTF